MVAVAALFVGLAFFAYGPAARGVSAQAGAANIPFGTAQPVNAIILADESGSMQQYTNEVTGEQQAAAQIVQEEWSPQSQIAIYGFGSAPDKQGAQPQAAIDQYCAPTELTNSAAREKLAGCAAKIQPRSPAEGDNTDFAEALTQALNILSAPQGEHRLPLVFILTDGQLDEGHDSPYSGWGSTDAAGNAAAQKLITNPSTGILHQLQSIGAEIWPVGFGQADTTELTLFARGGAQNACPAGSGAIPKATIIGPAVTGSEETEAIQSDLVGAFAEARCAVPIPPVWKELPTGGSVTETVTISPLATLGSLVVDKGDPRVSVTYTDPAGHKLSDKGLNEQVSNSIDGIAYVLTGQSQSSLETLRLDGPLSGRWTVTFTSAAGVAAQMVGLSAVWQGEVDLEFVKQAVGDPGNPYTLAVQLAARSAPVPASALAGLQAGFTVTWPGGQQSTAAAHLEVAGDFDATVPVPQNINGTARATVTLAGPGVQGQEETAFSVTPGGGLTVSLNIPPNTTVAPGGMVKAQAIVDNDGLPATNIVFSLGGLGDGVLATLTPGNQVHVKSGRQLVPVTIQFDQKTRLGPVLGTIRWEPVDLGTSASADWLAIDPLDVIVQNPGTPLVQQPLFLSVSSTAFAVAVAAVVLLLWRQRQQREETILHGGRPGATTSSRYTPAGGSGPRKETGRYAPGSRSAQTRPESGDRRSTRWGWRSPWR